MGTAVARTDLDLATGPRVAALADTAPLATLLVGIAAGPAAVHRIGGVEA